MIVQVRTSRDLLDTLRIGLSPAWSVSMASLQRQGTIRVHVVNWDGTIRIEATYCEALSIENHPDHPIGRTVIGFTDGKNVLCSVSFPNPRNPVSYHELMYEESTRAVPAYSVIDGKWPAPSRDEAQSLYPSGE
ncbi:MAG: hypothetical protein ACK528_14260 [Alphaproteobacteria bacterium]